MDFKKLLSEIREALGDDIGKVDAKLKQIEREADSLSSELIDVKKEAKERRLNERKLQSQIEEKETLIEEWKQKAENPEGKEEFETIKAENEKLKERWASVLTEKRKTLQAEFEKLEKNPKWEKAKKQFRLPEEKDGAYLFDKWTDEDVEHNAAKLQELKELEYFADSEPPRNALNNMRNVSDKTPNYDELESADDIMGHVFGELVKK